ncbi:hypothetical protein L3X38_042043 [Prunus dulcis]|uniref:Uncharacterized protein n=1 Tax=Prunus dulcis TaxID=3755 RepID=A0AAD4UU68_PRUDU|nr:hypothetical protein L3X38_042043 [Prunus dulcis]
MIKRAKIADFDVGRILIDTGNSVNVIFVDAFGELGINNSHVNRQPTSLFSFLGDLVQPIGRISLPITFGVTPRKTMVYDQFLIVDCPKAYNVIIGQTTLTGIKAHLSHHMLLMKFPTCHSIGTIRGDQLSAWTCYATALNSAAFKSPRESLTIARVSNDIEPQDDPRDKNSMPQAACRRFGNCRLR